MTYPLATLHLDEKPEQTGGQSVMKTTFVREVRAVYCGPRRATTKVRGPSDAAQFTRRMLSDNSREQLCNYLYISNLEARVGIVRLTCSDWGENARFSAENKVNHSNRS